MRFKINNKKWIIKESDTKELAQRFEDSEDAFLYGFCSYTENVIYLNNTLCLDRKIYTLKHELTHAWTFEHGWGFDDDVSREDLCNIVASINEFINTVTNKYFKKIKE